VTLAEVKISSQLIAKDWNVCYLLGEQSEWSGLCSYSGKVVTFSSAALNIMFQNAPFGYMK